MTRNGRREEIIADKRVMWLNLSRILPTSHFTNEKCHMDMSMWVISTFETPGSVSWYFTCHHQTRLLDIREVGYTGSLQAVQGLEINKILSNVWLWCQRLKNPSKVCGGFMYLIKPFYFTSFSPLLISYHWFFVVVVWKNISYWYKN